MINPLVLRATPRDSGMSQPGREESKRKRRGKAKDPHSQQTTYIPHTPRHSWPLYTSISHQPSTLSPSLIAWHAYQPWVLHWLLGMHISLVAILGCDLMLKLGLGNEAVCWFRVCLFGKEFPWHHPPSRVLCPWSMGWKATDWSLWGAPGWV